MMRINQNVDLAPTLTGWETAAANAFDVTVFTANWTAGVSLDSGHTFTSINPNDAAKTVGDTFCCDQSVTYVPRINTFVWAILSNEGPIILAVASPEQIRDSKGLAWTLYHLTPRTFHFEKDDFDYPDVSFGDDYLYITFNSDQQGGAIIVRYPLQQIGDRQTLIGQFVHLTDVSYISPAQLTGDHGWFGVMKDTSTLRVYGWAQTPSARVTHFDVPIPTVPTEDWSSITPDGDDWLPPTSKIDWSVTGAARAGQELWLAWSGARRVAGQRENAFPHPHIGLAVISLQGSHLIRVRHLWSRDHAYAWPSLAATPGQEVGISYAYGGNGKFPQHGVGTLRRQWDFQLTTSGRSTGSGGHFVRVRMGFPNVDEFVAGGYVALKDAKHPEDLSKVVNHPHYVLFSD
jgi:hypothetical protein